MEVAPRSASNKRRRAPLEGGVEVVALGMGKSTLICPEKESKVLPWLFWSVIVILDAEVILGASR